MTCTCEGEARRAWRVALDAEPLPAEVRTAVRQEVGAKLAELAWLLTWDGYETLLGATSTGRARVVLRATSDACWEAAQTLGGGGLPDEQALRALLPLLDVAAVQLELLEHDARIRSSMYLDEPAMFPDEDDEEKPEDALPTGPNGETCRATGETPPPAPTSPPTAAATPAGLSEETIGGDQDQDQDRAAGIRARRVATLLDGKIDPRILEIAERRNMIANDKQAAIFVLDNRVAGWLSGKWGELLAISARAARETDWYQNVRPKLLAKGDHD
jgi:hypothetical protein